MTNIVLFNTVPATFKRFRTVRGRRAAMDLGIILTALILTPVLIGQQTQVLWDDFSQGNRRGIWRLEPGGVSGSFPLTTLSFSNNAMTVTVGKNPPPATAITGVVNDGQSGIKIYSPGHGLDNLYCVNVANVGGVTNANGLWSVKIPAPTDSTIPDITNTSPPVVHMPGHGMSTGQHVRHLQVANAPDWAVGSFTITVIDADHYSLNDVTPDAPYPAYMAVFVNDEWLSLVGAAFSGAYVPGTGTVQMAGCGFSATAVLSNGGATFPSGYFSGNGISGQWYNDILNAMEVTATCDVDLPDNNPYNTQSFGTYTGAQVVHYYNNFGQRMYANRPATFRMDRHPAGIVGQYNGFAADNEYWIPSQSPDYTAHHFLDYLAKFYFQFPAIPMGVHDLPQFSNMTCSFQNIIAKSLLAQPWSWVSQLAATYSGPWSTYTNGRIDVSWAAPYYVSNPNPIKYDVRYSTSGPCSTNGWSNCTDGGQVTFSTFPYKFMSWRSPNIMVNANTYVAIRPHMQVFNVSGNGQSPIVITPWEGHDLLSGDTVSISGINGNTAANGTWTVDNINPRRFYVGVDPNVLSITVDASHVATVTTAIPHGVVLGQGLIANIGVAYDRYAVVTSVTPTTFSWASPNSAPGTYNKPGYWAVTLPSLTLRGSTGNGGYTGGGEVVATSETSNFAEIQIPVSSGTVSASYSPCDVDHSGSVDSNDVRLEAEAVVGSRSCTNSPVGDGCTIIDVQRIANAASGLGCKTGGY